MASWVSQKNFDSKTLNTKRQEMLQEVNARARNYAITALNPPRLGKKLLVLDLDHTILDYEAFERHSEKWIRPHLRTFLETVCRHYDIAIWSATAMPAIVKKMVMLNVTELYDNFQFVFYIDYDAMVAIYNRSNEIVMIKPLSIIWKQFPLYTSKNTIMLDDIRENFLDNPRNGLVVQPYSVDKGSNPPDTELLLLGVYLASLAKETDLSVINHAQWPAYGGGTSTVDTGAPKKEPELQPPVPPGQNGRTILIPRPRSKGIRGRNVVVADDPEKRPEVRKTPSGVGRTILIPRPKRKVATAHPPRPGNRKG